MPVTLIRTSAAVGPLAALALALAAAGCGSGGSSSSASPAVSTSAPATATHTSSRSSSGAASAGSAGAGALSADAHSAATGDIPDNQVFLSFGGAAAGWSMKYPEGWTQRGARNAVAFADKNNLVHVTIARGPAPTPASVAARLAQLRASRPSLSFTAPRAIALPGDTAAIRATYTTRSAPDPVTARRVTLTVDRYVLHRGARVATVDLGTPRGVDNVDAYRMMIESFPVAVSSGPAARFDSLWREPEAPAAEVSWPALQMRDVFKIFRSGPVETVALRGLELRVEPAEVVAVLGPSGCGKSTMLTLAAALDQPSAGEVRVGERSLQRLHEDELAGYRARGVAIVFQSDNLWPQLSARENVALGLRLAREPLRYADEALRAFGLATRGDHRAGALSGGEQQRVAIAAAFARRAPLVLADEPTGELDAGNELAVLQALGELRARSGSAIVVVTHSAAVAAAADRVLEMRDGRVVA